MSDKHEQPHGINPEVTDSGMRVQMTSLTGLTAPSVWTTLTSRAVSRSSACTLQRSSWRSQFSTTQVRSRPLRVLSSCQQLARTVNPPNPANFQVCALGMIDCTIFQVVQYMCKFVGESKHSSSSHARSLLVCCLCAVQIVVLLRCPSHREACCPHARVQWC